MTRTAKKMKCLHCRQPVVPIQTAGNAFTSWRHEDGRMFCATGGHIATPDYSR